MQVFALAAECAMERSRLIAVEEALDLWALAASLQVDIPAFPAFLGPCCPCYSAVSSDYVPTRVTLSLTSGAYTC